ncbi:PE-PGRS family protein [Mycobacterium tuberculosis EAS054]|nr:PE-PGRS family protein [Mycobacterium tuberculosis EAS054]
MRVGSVVPEGPPGARQHHHPRQLQRSAPGWRSTRGGNVYVTNFGSGTVSVINPATNTVTGSPITIGNGPSGVAVSPVTGLVFVTNFDSNTVSVIDPTTNTVTGSPITVGTAPTGVAVNPVTGEVYVTNFAGDTVSVIS